MHIPPVHCTDQRGQVQDKDAHLLTPLGDLGDVTRPLGDVTRPFGDGPVRVASRTDAMTQFSSVAALCDWARTPSENAAARNFFSPEVGAQARSLSQTFDAEAQAWQQEHHSQTEVKMVKSDSILPFVVTSNQSTSTPVLGYSQGQMFLSTQTHGTPTLHNISATAVSMLPRRISLSALADEAESSQDGSTSALRSSQRRLSLSLSSSSAFTHSTSGGLFISDSGGSPNLSRSSSLDLSGSGEALNTLNSGGLQDSSPSDGTHVSSASMNHQGQSGQTARNVGVGLTLSVKLEVR